MSDYLVTKKPDVMTVRVKTVREVKAPEAELKLWYPPLKRDDKPEWHCTNEVHRDDLSVCTDCYGTGVRGAYVQTETFLVQDLSYAEEQDGPEDDLEELTSLTFYCAVRHHVFNGCLYDFDDRAWKVAMVEQADLDEDDDGEFLPERWDVWCRKLDRYESAYYFLRNERGVPFAC